MEEKDTAAMEQQKALEQERARQQQLLDDLEQEVREERKRQAEENSFIASQVIHEKQERRLKEQQQAEEEQARREEKAVNSDDEDLVEEEEEELSPEEEAYRMEQADEVVGLLAAASGDKARTHQIIDDLVTGRMVTEAQKKWNEAEALKKKGEQKAPDLPGEEAPAKAEPQAEAPEKEPLKQEAEKPAEKEAPKQEANDPVEEEPGLGGQDKSVEDMFSSVSMKNIPADIRATMVGNALRSFTQYIAGELPLSAKHVEAALLCKNIVKRANQQHMTPAQMGLNQEEWLAVQGSIQLGDVVKRGLNSQKLLLEKPNMPGRRQHLRNYLTMKALEQAMIPHVQMHGEDIAKGDVPICSVQIMLGSPGFSARDMWSMVNKTPAMGRFAAMGPEETVSMLEGHRRMGSMARDAMTDCYNGSLQRGKAPKAGAQRGKNGVAQDPIQPAMKRN